MSRARKFVYIPSDSLARFGAPPNVQRTYGDSLREAALDTLNRKDISDEEKMTQFTQDQQQYLVQKRLLDAPLKIGLESEEEQGKPLTALQSVINTFPRDPARTLAQDLVSFLYMSADGLQWNSQGEISVDGLHFPNSSLARLVNDVISNSPSLNPIGSDHFARVLRRSGVPGHLVRESTGKYRPAGFNQPQQQQQHRSPSLLTSRYQPPPAPPPPPPPSSAGSSSALDQQPSTSSAQPSSAPSRPMRESRSRPEYQTPPAVPPSQQYLHSLDETRRNLFPHGATESDVQFPIQPTELSPGSYVEGATKRPRGRPRGSGKKHRNLPPYGLPPSVEEAENEEFEGEGNGQSGMLGPYRWDRY